LACRRLGWQAKLDMKAVVAQLAVAAAEQAAREKGLSAT
jgi:hypothetical protein